MRPTQVCETAAGTGPELHALVRTYVSYLSGCDACALESLREANTARTDLSRLLRLSTWRRAPLPTYSERERTALVWAEVVAVMGEGGVGEGLRRQAEEHFRADELDALTRVVTGSRAHRRLMLERAGAVATGRRRGDPCPARENLEACAAPR